MNGAADARLYLQDHRIPQLFEGLMTGLIYSRPENPLGFIEECMVKIRTTPGMVLAWDMFLPPSEESSTSEASSSAPVAQARSRPPTKSQVNAPKPQIKTNAIEEIVEVNGEDFSREPSRTNTVEHRTPEPRVSSEEKEEEMVVHRVPSVTRAAEVAKIPDAPIILFMGGPGGGKTRHAARVADSLVDNGLVHICMPDIIRSALGKYKDKYPEWKEANEHYIRGELIPNQLALTLLKAEMGRHPDAHGFFLEGYPREARQVEDFERQVKSVNMALILDYDERTLREHMERRGLGMEIIDQKIKEFKQKTLPSAKYFDDQKLLHLIPGEKDDQTIYEKMKQLVVRALETGVPVLSAQPPTPAERNHIPTPPTAASDSITSAPSPVMAEAEITNTIVNTNVANHEIIDHDLSTSAIREPRIRSVAQTPLTSSGSRVGSGARAEELETPSVQTPDESRATSTARSRESAKKENNRKTDRMSTGQKSAQNSNEASETSSVDLGEPIGLPNNAPVVLVLDDGDGASLGDSKKGTLNSSLNSTVN
uniref:Adenylate kinase isoenzyme 5 n=1 Tax=Caenorhabditis japonica TaxID=281687 RepID=A0A8R1HZU2_CAEJA